MTDEDKKIEHEPVMVREVLEGFNIAHSNESQKLLGDKKFIDATLGLGGHSLEIIKRGGKVLGIDTDVETLQRAGESLRSACPTPQVSERCFSIAHGNFSNIDELAKTYGYETVNGVLFDLGVNSSQLKSLTRGFSFANPDAVLDMRLDKENQAVTAADMLNLLDKRKLEEVFGKVMRFDQSQKLARLVIRKRNTERFEKVGDFLQVIKKVFKFDGGVHPATLPFMAIRMAVNSELENLSSALPKAYGLLGSGGRMVVISFHSGEDLIVKTFFRQQVSAKIITKKPIKPTDEEIRINPRARSAKLRILEKI